MYYRSLSYACCISMWAITQISSYAFSHFYRCWYTLSYSVSIKPPTKAVNSCHSTCCELIVYDRNIIAFCESAAQHEVHESHIIYLTGMWLVFLLLTCCIPSGTSLKCWYFTSGGGAYRHSLEITSVVAMSESSHHVTPMLSIFRKG